MKENFSLIADAVTAGSLPCSSTESARHSCPQHPVPPCSRCQPSQPPKILSSPVNGSDDGIVGAERGRPLMRAGNPMGSAGDARLLGDGVSMLPAPS